MSAGAPADRLGLAPAAVLRVLLGVAAGVVAVNLGGLVIRDEPAERGPERQRRDSVASAPAIRLSFTIWTYGDIGPFSGILAEHRHGAVSGASSIAARPCRIGQILTAIYGTEAYDLTTGATLWASRHSFRTASPAGSQAQSIAVSPDGAKVFVTGELISLGPPTGDTMVTLGYNS